MSRSGDPRDVLADELLMAVEQAEQQLLSQYGPPPPGYRDRVVLDHVQGEYVVSIVRELAHPIHLTVVGH